MSYGRKTSSCMDYCGSSRHHVPHKRHAASCMPHKYLSLNAHRKSCGKHHHKPSCPPSYDPSCKPPFMPLPTYPMPTYPMPTCPPFNPLPWPKPYNTPCHKPGPRPCPPPFPPIVGPTGPTGPAGTAGAAGPTGPTGPTGPAASGNFLAANVVPASGTTTPLTSTATALNLTQLSASGITVSEANATFDNAGTYVINLSVPVTTAGTGTATLSFTPTLSTGGSINPSTFSTTLQSGLTNVPVTYNALATIPAGGTLSFTAAATGTTDTVTPGTGTLIVYQVG